MLIDRNGAQTADPWIRVDGDMVGGGDAPLLVTLDQWRQQRDRLIGHNGPLGIVLKDNESPALIAQDLERFSLIALEFPAFKNGRAYSSARLLRQRFNYPGEIRAMGDVLRDQIAFMIRCGFDRFELPTDFPLDAWQDIVGEMTHVYQAAADDRTPVVEQRHTP